ncbi:DUF445 family protein [Listeria floridensis]|uniref:DUF445 family protein n=1 Tax=Listeria floridensis TaxID=1494962 RepID=UPI0004B49D30|nr:DUF445 family protein [Listeria floridensis]
MGSFAKMFLNLDTLTEKAQSELEKMLLRPEMKVTIETMLVAEWHHLLDKKLADVLSEEKKAELLMQMKMESRAFLAGEKWLNRPLQENLAKYQVQISDHIIPYVVERLLDFASNHSADILNRLEIAALIEKQISTFSLAEVEQIVVDISGKELKMITYLGGFLGGLIGIIQGILAIWM